MKTIAKVSAVLFLATLLLNGGCRRTRITDVGDAPKAADSAAAKSEAETVAAIEAVGANVSKDGNGIVTTVDFRGTSVGDESLSQLQELKSMRSLLLNDTAVTDAGMVAVGKLKSLTNLDLRGCEVTNEGVKSLSGLSNLKALRFSGKNGKTDLSDDIMDVVAKFPKLKVLALDFLKFTAGSDGLSKLSAQKDMQELYIGNTLVNDDSLKVISDSFPKLKKLRAAASQVSDEGLVHIAKMAELEELDLSENSLISDFGLEHIGGMTKLKKLNLWKVPIADDGVEYLAGLTNLEWLNLDQTGLSDVGLVHLTNMTKLTFMHLGSTGISDEGLVHLQPLTALKDLKVTRTDVTAEGVAELKKTLTNTAIQLKYVEGQ